MVLVAGFQDSGADHSCRRERPRGGVNRLLHMRTKNISGGAMRILLASAFCLTISGLGIAQTTPAVVSPPSAPSISGCTTIAARPSDQTRFSERNPRYHLEPGDSFDLTFEFVPDF